MTGCYIPTGMLNFAHQFPVTCTVQRLEYLSTARQKCPICRLGRSFVFDVISKIDLRCAAYRKMTEGRHDLHLKTKVYYTYVGKKQPLSTKYKRNLLKFRVQNVYGETCHHLMR